MGAGVTHAGTRRKNNDDRQTDSADVDILPE